jgi:predicted nucleic acid-binding protein
VALHISLPASVGAGTRRTGHPQGERSPRTSESILEALGIEERNQVSFWDALVIQAADTDAASVLYSENLSSG